MNTTVRGHFVCLVSREWESFKADDGKEVKAGVSRKAFVYEPESNVLHQINCKNIAGVGEFTFGVRVQADCEVHAYKGQLILTATQFRAEQPAAAGKAA